MLSNFLPSFACSTTKLCFLFSYIHNIRNGFARFSVRKSFVTSFVRVHRLHKSLFTIPVLSIWELQLSTVYLPFIHLFSRLQDLSGPKTKIEWKFKEDVSTIAVGWPWRWISRLWCIESSWILFYHFNEMTFKRTTRSSQVLCTLFDNCCTVEPCSTRQT